MSQPTKDAVRRYLVSIGKVPLLTHEQELEYGRKIQEYQRLVSLKEAMESDIGFTLSDEQWAITVELPTKELQRKVRQGEWAKKKLIEANLRLVVAVAKKYQNRGLELLDLIQEGSIGLTRAAEKFEPSKGFKFSTYAYWWIRQEITRSLNTYSRTIRLPIHIHEKLNKLKKGRREFTEKYQRTPSLKEIAVVMNLTEEKVRELLELTQKSCSLDMIVGQEEDTTLLDLMADQSYNPDEELVRLDYAEQAKECLETLSEIDRQIIWARLAEEKSLQTVGDELGVSRERIRQRQNKALQKVRNAQKEKKVV